jgi:energy-coupling factor transport system substrate-specific component
MKLRIKEITVFAMLGALLFALKKVMEFAPNIHLVGVFIIAMTVVYRKKALYPLYIYVFLDGLFGGFSTWWLPYTYIWTILWGVTMLLPKKMNPKIQPVIYMVVCSLHGFLYGILYSPFQALFFNLDFKGTIAWIVAGFPFDIIHGISNFICGLLIVPIITVLKRVEKYAVK